MSNPSSPRPEDKLKLVFDAPVQGRNQVFGPDGKIIDQHIEIAQVIIYSGAQPQTLQVSASDPRLQPANLFVQNARDQTKRLGAAHFSPGLVDPALDVPESPGAPGGVGGPLAPGGQGGMAPQAGHSPSGSLTGLKSSSKPPSQADIEQLVNNFPNLIAQLHQLDTQFGGSVQELVFNNTRFNVIDLLLRQGNLAVWRFRRAAARLINEQRSALMARVARDWPVPPQWQALSAQANKNIDVQRGLVLMMSLGPMRPDLIEPVGNQLTQGRWREVVDDWETRQVLDSEMIQQIRTELESIGQPYSSQEVRATAKEAETALNEAYQRQPQNPTVLVNLATIKAETGLFFYIETGTSDPQRLKSARALFGQARDLLSQQRDRAGQSALGKCLLYAATTLPPDAKLEAVPVARLQAQLARASHTLQGQKGIRWDVMQRNLARSNPQFYDEAGIRQAHDLFVRSGEAALAEQCMLMLRSLQGAKDFIPRYMELAGWAAPIVGTWAYQGGNRFSRASGKIVFDAEGFVHWQATVATGPMGQPQHSIFFGSYQVNPDKTIMMEGESQSAAAQMYGMPGVTPSARFKTQIVIRGQQGNQLFLFFPADTTEFRCQRL